MTVPLRRPATYGDVLSAPPNMVAEVIYGALHTQPRPASAHARISSVLGGKIGGPFDFDGDDSGPGGWWILDEPELHLGPHILVPDIAGWRRSAMPQIPNVAYFEKPPNWVCEVLSPSTRKLDQTSKADIYAEFGVDFMWHVDPDTRVLAAFQLSDGKWLRLAAFKDDDEVAAAPFDAVPFKLDGLWLQSE